MRLFSVLSTTLAALAATTVATAADRSADQQIAADPRGIVEISNFGGKVEVTGWDQQQVSVHSDSSDDVSTVDVRSDHGRTVITVRLHGFSFGGGEAHLRVKIPRNSELDVTTVGADITSNNMLGVQRLKAVNGSIKADVSAADMEAKTVSGDITLHGDGKPGSMHLSNISGGIRLDHVAGDLEAITVSGDLKAQFEGARSLRARTTSGPISLSGKLAKDADVDAQTVSGDVTLHTGSDGGYDYEVSTFSGDIRNCFSQQVEKARYGPGARLTGSRGNGNAHVRVKTMSGQIDLCDKS